MTSPRVYDVKTQRTPYGYLAACTQHAALALHSNRAVAEGLVVWTVMCSVGIRAVTVPVIFRFSTALD